MQNLVQIPCQIFVQFLILYTDGCQSMAEEKDPSDGGKKLDVIVESELDPNVLISHYHAHS